MKSVVLFSGGQDSTTCLYWAIKEACDNPDGVLALSVNYGQKHAVELEAARKIAKIAGVAHEVIDLPTNTLIGNSPLLQTGEQLETYANFVDMTAKIGNRIEHTFVPLRNLLFMVLAANRAASLGARAIVTGICEADTANYPDCRYIFAVAAEGAIDYALGSDRSDGPDRIVIKTPLIKKSKGSSIRLAMTLPGCYEALAYSHTAYDGHYPPIGMDHASLLRAQGFFEAGMPDPLVVRAWADGKMPLPLTGNYEVVRGRFPGGPVPTLGADYHVGVVAGLIGAARGVPA